MHTGPGEIGGSGTCMSFAEFGPNASAAAGWCGSYGTASANRGWGYCYQGTSCRHSGSAGRSGDTGLGCAAKTLIAFGQVCHVCGTEPGPGSVSNFYIRKFIL